MAHLNQFRRDVQGTLTQAEAMIALSKEQGFSLWMNLGTLFRGWSLAMQGQPEDGIVQMEQSLASNPAGSFHAIRPWHDALLVEAYVAAGQTEAGLSKVADSLALVEKGGFRFYEAELRRLHGELLLMQPDPNASEAETCIQQALDLAHEQQSKSLELRAAISLSRLWIQQDKKVEAYKLLNEIYGWFSEGFNTADLKEARALMDDLSQGGTA